MGCVPQRDSGVKSLITLCLTCAPFKGSFQKYRHFERIDILTTPSFSVSAIETHDYLSLNAWE